MWQAVLLLLRLVGGDGFSDSVCTIRDGEVILATEHNAHTHDAMPINTELQIRGFFLLLFAIIRY